MLAMDVTLAPLLASQPPTQWSSHSAQPHKHLSDEHLSPRWHWWPSPPPNLDASLRMSLLPFHGPSSKSCLPRQRAQLLNQDGPHDHPTMHPPYFEHAGSDFGTWECPETLIQCDICICSTGPQSMTTCKETKRRRNQPTTTQDPAISASPHLVCHARA